MEIETFRKGDVIIEKGTHGTCAYVIESGRVEVSDLVNNKKIVLAVLEEEQIFGEMGLVEDQPRSVTVTAVEDVQLAVQDKAPVTFYGKMGGVVPLPEDILAEIKTLV